MYVKKPGNQKCEIVDVAVLKERERG